ncbi:MAG TPA: hypothetical protein VN744_11890 [Casimicrobiaceae bacterium]|nr:hypothetical protein [Casimicrobiaceae bacterium]
MKKTALFAGLVLAAAAAALVLALRAAGKADAPGFFGAGTLLADINILLELLLVGGLTFGMMLAKSGNIAAHRVNQSAWVMVNAALVALIMIPSIRTFKLAHLSDLGNSGNLIVVVHAAIGAATLLAGLWLVLQMNDILPARWHIRGWKTLMRATLAGYWAIALLGIATYRVWYA